MASFAKSRTSLGAGTSPARAFGGFSAPSTSLSYVAEPPKLSSISDTQVAVSFKNLQKKDGTTKAKALEDLVTHVQAHPFEAHGGVEDAILDAWVRLLSLQRFSPDPS